MLVILSCAAAMLLWMVQYRSHIWRDMVRIGRRQRSSTALFGGLSWHSTVPPPRLCFSFWSMSFSYLAPHSSARHRHESLSGREKTVQPSSKKRKLPSERRRLTVGGLDWSLLVVRGFSREHPRPDFEAEKPVFVSTSQ